MEPRAGIIRVSKYMINPFKKKKKKRNNLFSTVMVRRKGS